MGQSINNHASNSLGQLALANAFSLTLLKIILSPAQYPEGTCQITREDL